MSRQEFYKKLLSKSYNEAVQILLNKYGPSVDDYFRESSYRLFLAGKIKTIKKGNTSRTNEGLYCHHIDENKWENMTSLSTIKLLKTPFANQKKDRLVYADLIEHAILHTLIAKETSGNLGLLGYEIYLKPMIEEWYIEEKIPNTFWMGNCYQKAFSSPTEAVIIIKKMQNVLGMDYTNSPLEYHEEKHRKLEEHRKQIELNRKRRYQEETEWRIREEERINLAHKKKALEFFKIYPRFEQMKIQYDIPRRKVIALLYEQKYKDLYKSKKDLDLVMKPIIKDDLLEDLYLNISTISKDKVE